MAASFQQLPKQHHGNCLEKNDPLAHVPGRIGSILTTQEIVS